MNYSCFKKFFIFIAVFLTVTGFTPKASATEEILAFSLSNFLQFSVPISESASSSAAQLTATTSTVGLSAVTELSAEEFCEKLDEAISKLEISYLERRQAISANIEEQNKKFQEERQKYDEQRTWLRIRQDYYLRIYFDRLSQLAEAEMQEIGMEQYKENIMNALEKRRASADLALEEYRRDLDNLKMSKVTEMETRLIDYEEKLNGEILKVAETCEKGEILKAENSLQGRLLKLREEREKIFKDANGAERAIIAERDRKVAEAETRYKKTVDLAKENLIKFLTAE